MFKVNNTDTRTTPPHHIETSLLFCIIVLSNIYDENFLREKMFQKILNTSLLVESSFPNLAEKGKQGTNPTENFGHFQMPKTRK